MGEMSREDFLRMVADPTSGAPTTVGSKFSWVSLLGNLEDRSEPFTVQEIADEIKQNTRYVYAHLRDWVKDKKLVKVSIAGKNFYLHSKQIEEE